MNAPSCKKVVSQLYRRLVSLIVAHFTALHQQMDPIEMLVPGEMTPARKSIRGHFWLPLCIVILTPLWGIFWFQHEADQPLDVSSLLSSPYIFTHQAMPTAVWRQLDVGIGLDVVVAIAVYIALAATPAIATDCRMYQIEGRIFLGQTEMQANESEQIIRFRSRYQKLFEFSVLGFLGCLDVVVYANVLLNKHYSLSLSSLLFWPVAFFLFMAYIVYSLFGTIQYIIISCRYIRLRQRDISAQFSRINESIGRLNSRKKAGFVSVRVALWRRYLLQNVSLLQTCQLIAEYNRFCWPLLTILVPYYISVQCYLLYCILFSSIAPVLGALFGLAIFECNLFLFTLTRQCAHVHRINTDIELKSRQFYDHFLVNDGFQATGVSAMIKAQFFQSHRRLNSYTFKLLNVYKITSKTYHTILSYISVYFIFISKSDI